MDTGRRVGWAARVISAAAVFGRGPSLKGLAVAGVALTALAQAAPVSAAAERTLAGIRIFSRAAAVTQKYGNPSQVIVGSQSTTTIGGGGGGLGGGFPGGPGGYPGAGGGPGGYPGAGGFGGGYPGAGGAPGALPGFGGGYPGAGGLSEFGGGGKISPGGFGGEGMGGSPGGPGGYPGAGGFPGAAGGYPGAGGGFGAGQQTLTTKPNVTWVYDRPNGGSLEFTISPDGRVIQIRATGYTGTVRTAKGVALGQSYAGVVAKYGYPSGQYIQGPLLNADYSEKYHAAFQFYNQKVVGIIIAAVE